MLSNSLTKYCELFNNAFKRQQKKKAKMGFNAFYPMNQCFRTVILKCWTQQIDWKQQPMVRYCIRIVRCTSLRRWFCLVFDWQPFTF